MNKKTIFTILTFALAAALLFSSCEQKKPTNLKASFATVVPETPGEMTALSAYNLVTDDSLLLVPSNRYEFTKFKPDKDQRIVVYYTDNDENATPTTSPRSVTMVNIETILTKDVIFTNKIDTLGKGYATPTQIWCSGGVEGASRFVTIEFTFFTGAGPGLPHIVNLAVDKTNETPVVDGYLCMEFKHNDRGDIFKDIEAYGYLSCPLPEEAMAEGIKGLLIRFNEEHIGDHVVRVDF